MTPRAGTSREGRAQQLNDGPVMKHGYGRWFVGLTGIVVIVVGVAMVVEGVRTKFERKI